MLVSQGSVLISDLFNIYLSDVPIPPNTTLAMYAGDTAVIYTLNDDKVLINKLVLYKTWVQSAMMYASEVCKHCTKTHIQKLLVKQNKIIKCYTIYHFRTTHRTEHKSVCDRIFNRNTVYGITWICNCKSLLSVYPLIQCTGYIRTCVLRFGFIFPTYVAMQSIAGGLYCFVSTYLYQAVKELFEYQFCIFCFLQ